MNAWGHSSGVRSLDRSGFDGVISLEHARPWKGLMKLQRYPSGLSEPQWPRLPRGPGSNLMFRDTQETNTSRRGGAMGSAYVIHWRQRQPPAGLEIPRQRRWSELCLKFDKGA